MSCERDAAEAVRPLNTVENEDADSDGELDGLDEDVVLEDEGPEEEEREEDERQDEEEGRPPVTRKRPKMPSKREREEHEATHVPFRSWCRHCVRGRGRNAPHRSSAEVDEEEKLRQVPRIAMDYHFMSKEDERAQQHPIFTMTDEATGACFARAAGHKGLGENKEREWLVLAIVEELDNWGYRGQELILRADQESALEAVRKAVMAMRVGKSVPESPPVGESAANGRIEEAGKRMREFVRTMTDQLEFQIKEKLKSDAPITQWMIRWAGMLMTRYVVKEDGKTAYEKIKGRKCRDPVVPFGEHVWYKQLKVGPNNKAETSWQEGIWLGQCQKSNEVLIGTTQGVVRAWAVKRRTDDERWSAEAVRTMQGVPPQPVPGRAGSQVPIRVRVDVDQDLEAEPHDLPRRENAPRRTRLERPHFEKHGWSDDCQGCRRAQAGLSQAAHTEACRRRMEEAMYQDEADKARVESAEGRARDYLEREVGNHDAPGEEAPADREGEAQPQGEVPEEPEEQQPGTEAPARGPTISTDEAREINKRARMDRKNERRRTQRRRISTEQDAVEVNMEVEPPKEESESKRARVAARPEEDTMMRDDPGASGSGDPQPEMAVDDGTRSSVGSTGRQDDDGDTLMKLLVKMIKGVDLTEVYSPERVLKEAKKYGLSAGLAMDLLTGYDFNKPEDRKRAEQHLDQDHPLLVVGSPMCTMFSTLQALTRWTPVKEEMYQQSVAHMEWTCRLYEKQIEAGRIFLHEQPAGATSWKLGCVKRLASRDDVYLVTADQCMYGQVARDRKGRVEGAARKRTKFMTNSWWLAQELCRRCDGGHAHVQLLGGRAAETAKYPQELCRAICRGLIKEKRARTMNLKAVATVSPPGRGAKVPDSNEFHDAEEVRTNKECISLMANGEAWDDVSGVRLDFKKVREARREEMTYIRKKGVYKKIRRSEAVALGYKIVKVRWIDINKGDESHPLYRSRLVAKEFHEKDSDDNLFAGTPPLEALKAMVSEAATVRKGAGESKVMLIADVSRAFFEAKARRKVCVELVDEDRTAQDKEEDMVGLLELSMYGTRDAAINWQEEVARVMIGWGFRRGKYNPCLYWHRQMRTKVLVHGDDFVAVDFRGNIEWLRQKLASRFEIKTTMIGDGENEEKEGKVLNRVVRITDDGWEYEADQRHAEIIVEAMKLGDAKSVSTPGGDEEKDWETEENAEELNAEDSTRFRAIAARANYLALDRADLQYAVKEVCRAMAKPTVGAKKKLKRVARYLKGKPRMVWAFNWRGEENDIETFGDSNWAGCKTTGRSTSGGVATIGGHVLKTWSHTQKTVALSSAEAELTALVKATCEGIGIAAMMADWGEELGQIVYADANAALGVVRRRGAGKLRHVNVGMLWVQEKAHDEVIAYKKVEGPQNPSDLMTKYNSLKDLKEHCKKIKLEERAGRAAKSVELSRGINSFKVLSKIMSHV